MDTKERNPFCLTQPPPENHAGARSPEHLYWEKQKGPDYFRNQGPHKKRQLPTLPHCIAVPSAQPGLTSLFGMGRGGTPAQ